MKLKQLTPYVVKHNPFRGLEYLFKPKFLKRCKSKNHPTSSASELMHHEKYNQLYRSPKLKYYQEILKVLYNNSKTKEVMCLHNFYYYRRIEGKTFTKKSFYLFIFLHVKLNYNKSTAEFSWLLQVNLIPIIIKI